MTVYLCIFGSILLMFGGMGVLLAHDAIFQIAWGVLLLIGVITIGVTLYYRPGTNTRTI